MSSSECGLFNCACATDASLQGGPDWKWVFGVTLGIIGSLGTTVGTVLQKGAHSRQQAGQTSYHEVNGILCSPLWLLGFFFQVIVPLPLDAVALAIAPQSIIAPLSGVTIVLSQVVAPVALGEAHPTRMEWCATAVVLIGTVLLAVVGDQCSMEYTVDEIRSLYHSSTFIACEVLQVILVVLAYLVLCLPAVTERWPAAAPFSFALLAGVLGGQQNVMFKGASENFEQSFNGNTSGWQDWVTYALLVGTVGCAVLQLMNLNRGLAMMEATRYLPAYNAFLICFSSISGLIFYQEYLHLTALGGIAYGGAVAVIVLGVALLAKTSAESSATRQMKAKDDPGMETSHLLAVHSAM